jgi:hypothetical protein
MDRMTIARLEQVLGAHHGAVIVGMVCRTEPELLRKSRRTGQATAERWPHGVEKLVRGQFLLGSCYQGGVRRQRRREGHPRPDDFHASRQWHGHGRHVGRFLIEHVDTGRLYVRARPKSDEHGYPVRLYERWIDLATCADVVGDELVELQRDWLRDPPRRSAKQQLAKQIPYRAYQLLSVHSVLVDGRVCRLAPDREAYTRGG